VSRISLLSCIVLSLTFGCAADIRGDGDGGTTGPDGSIVGNDAGAPDSRLPFASVTGTIWAPGNAPGMVPPGEEIPVFNALVQVRTSQPDGIPNMVHCERCVEAFGFTGTSAHDGSFSVTGITPGSYWLVIQKGQFRLEQQINLGPGETLSLDTATTTLPSLHSPELGQWVPRIAVGTGSYDELQDVLGKMGIGAVDADGSYMTDGAGSNRIDFYYNGGEHYTPESGTLADLVADYGRLQQYHIVFIPCSGSLHTAALQQPGVLQNLRQYVSDGGKLYVTDWSGEWHDNVFPAHIELEAGHDTPAAAYDRASNSWNTSQFGDADGSSYNSEHAEAVDDDLRLWLDGQMGPLALGGNGVFNASDMVVEGSWNTIMNTNRVEIGVDDEGLAVLDDPRVYVIGDQDGALPKRPLTVTYEPVGCGRVLYSTYHTTETAHQGLAPQERILLYLIMEIGVCKEGPILI